MSGWILRDERAGDESSIRALIARAFQQDEEADLVERLRADGDLVLSRVAEVAEVVIGHLAFSRLWVDTPEGRAAAVALAPLSVDPLWQGRGVAGALIGDAHDRLRLSSESLSIVLGHPAFYGRFGYESARADAFESDYQGRYLQALDLGGGPRSGRLIYATAFSAL